MNHASYLGWVKVFLVCIGILKKIKSPNLLRIMPNNSKHYLLELQCNVMKFLIENLYSSMFNLYVTHGNLKYYVPDGRQLVHTYLLYDIKNRHRPLCILLY